MSHYRTQVYESYAELPDDLWSSLMASTPGANPLVSLPFLRAIEASGSAQPETGWQSQPVVVWQNDQAIAAFPAYLKGHSYGEFVFDHAWARALEEAGGRYYPKWLIASPFSPVPGARMLTASGSAEDGLRHQQLGIAAQALTELVAQSGLSSAHMLFCTEDEAQALLACGWLERHGVQFHWQNRGYADFEDYLNALTQPRRKKIRAERRKVAEAGVQTWVVPGEQATEEDWDFFYRCYCQTYLEHGNPPYLSRDAFARMARDMPEALLLCFAGRGGSGASAGAPTERMASALLMRSQQPEGLVLYGRYWGAVASVSCLHFELAYYTPLDWAIQNQVVRIEGGAQGEHKLWRGFDPVPTRSMHYIAEPRFREAVARFLARETRGMDHYLSELDDHRAFRTPGVSAEP